MRHTMNWALGLCLLLATLALGEQAATTGKNGDAKSAVDRAFLWKITSDTNTVFLAGSIHLGKKDYYPLPPEVENAFIQAKTLVVELDQSKVDLATMAKLIDKHGTYPAGQSLTKSLSKGTLDLFNAYCARKGLPVADLDRLRPWTLTMALAAPELMGIGMTTELGLENHFLTKAEKAKKPVLELESAEAQIKMLAGFSPELQEKLLAKTLTELPKLKESMEKIWATWQAGDAKGMYDEVLRPYRENKDFRALIEKSFDERNVTMTEKIEKFLKEREPYFVLVGAGHLVGDKGIVHLLESKKYKVEQVRRAVVKKKAG